MAVKNTKALAKFQRVLKEVRAAHPGKPFHWQQKEASRLMHEHKLGAASGRRTRKVTGKKVYSTKKISRAPIVVLEPRAKRAKHATDPHVSRALAIQRTIDKLEVMRKEQTSKQTRDIVQRAINHNHAKLREIDRAMRAKRA